MCIYESSCSLHSHQDIPGRGVRKSTDKERIKKGRLNVTLLHLRTHTKNEASLSVFTLAMCGMQLSVACTLSGLV